MSTLTIQLEAKLSEQLLSKLTDSANEAAHDVLRELIDRKLVDEEAVFLRLHREFVKTHLGRYVAIHNGALIDDDQDQRQLYIRTQNHFPGVPIGIFLVNQTPETRIRKHSTH